MEIVKSAVGFSPDLGKDARPEALSSVPELALRNAVKVGLGYQAPTS